jgi:hypothetical protein
VPPTGSGASSLSKEFSFGNSGKFRSMRKAVQLDADAPAVIDEWLVSEGGVVTEGKALLRYSSGGVSRKLVCPVVAGGTLVSRILVGEGAVAQPAQDVCSVEPCPHDESYHGVCTTCGEPVEDSEPSGGRRPGRGGEDVAGPREGFGLFGGVAHPELRRSRQGVTKQNNQRVKELQSKKKLALVLDLDHTLLHTMCPACEMQHNVMVRVMQHKTPREVFFVTIRGKGHFTKLRPHVRTFLEMLSELYELYIYTAGDRAYAQEMARLLDERNRYAYVRMCVCVCVCVCVYTHM